MRTSIARSLLFSVFTVFLFGCATDPSAPKNREVSGRKTPASAPASKKVIRSLQGKELDCATVDGIKTQLSKFREAGGRSFATTRTFSSSPSEMQIVALSRDARNPKIMNFWFQYGTGSMGSEPFSIGCNL